VTTTGLRFRLENRDDLALQPPQAGVVAKLGKPVQHLDEDLSPEAIVGKAEESSLETLLAP